MKTKFEAFYENKKIIIESEKGIWDAKQQAFDLFNVPKSKQGLVAIQSMQSKENKDFMYL